MIFFPKKRFGQNFLNDEKIINLIIKTINPKSSDLLIEIGPGLSALTKPTCKLVKKLFVIECDKNLVEFLKASSFSNKLCIFLGNVLNINFNYFFKNKKLIRIFGNIPYNISTKLLIHLLNFTKITKDIHIMLQKEVVDRLLANPGSKKYGRLSVIIRYYYKITKIFTVSSKSFYPKPKVQSTFILLKPKKNNKYPVLKNIRIFGFVTNLAFSQRRKFLCNSLSSVISKNNLYKININPFFRASDLTVKEYCHLANFLSN